MRITVGRFERREGQGQLPTARRRYQAAGVGMDRGEQQDQPPVGGLQDAGGEGDDPADQLTQAEVGQA